MPVIPAGTALPRGEVSHVGLHDLDAGTGLTIEPLDERCRLIPLRGCVTSADDLLAPGLPADGVRTVRAQSAATVAVIHGSWREPTGDSGVFRIVPAPAWWELVDEEPVIHREPATSALLATQRLELTCMAGIWTVSRPGGQVELQPGDRLTADKGEPLTATSTTPGYLLRASGRWGDDGAGPRPRPGDPVPYPTNTRFDPHYHDADEYWIIARGHGEIVTGGVRTAVGPGDTVHTPAGEIHDIAWVDDELLGVYVETSLTGQQRRGHLWCSVHGTPGSDAR